MLGAQNQPVTGDVKVAGGTLYWWRKTVGNEATIIAVNISEQASQASIPAIGDGPAEVMFEGRTAQRTAGAITDSFERYAVPIYRYHV
jgi:hypothetical protein